MSSEKMSFKHGPRCVNTYKDDNARFLSPKIDEEKKKFRMEGKRVAEKAKSLERRLTEHC